MHFNHKVQFTKVELERNRESGVFKQYSVPWSVDYEKVVDFADGEIQLDDGRTVQVEQFHSQIHKILDDKDKEKEAYDVYQRKLAATGMAELPDGGDDDDE